MKTSELILLLVTLLQRPSKTLLKIVRSVLRTTANSITILFAACFPFLAGATQEVITGAFPLDTAVVMLVYFSILAYNRHKFLQSSDKITIQIKERFGEVP